MIEKFRIGVRDLDVLYQAFLPDELLGTLHRLAEAPKEAFTFPDRNWVWLIFHFALACHRRVMSTEHIIKSLTPLYLGKVASFVIETWNSSAEEVERRLEELCLTFEREKPALIKIWTQEG